MPSAERRHRRNCAMRREHTRVRREYRRPKNRRLSFPLFWETTKEDAISYRDWRSEIEDALEHGHDAAKVKEAMFASLEGMARDNAKMIDENGDLHVTHILDGLDSLYGVSMTFQPLNAALCGLQQRQMESASAYYNRMAQITLILRECHGNRYRPGELARMSKDCFYVGLLPENRPMVVHLKDQPHTTPLDLLKALLEQEENDTLTRTRYPSSTSSRTSQLSKPAGDEGEDKLEPTKLSTQQRQELLLAALERDSGLDRLRDWPPELVRRAKALLLEFHHVFSLEPNEIGCTDATKHVIELMKDEPFKERFCRIAPPLVDEVRQHIQERLDGSAI